jgi:hypothetical protein
MLSALLSLLSKDSIYSLGTLPPALSLSKTSCFIVGSITSSRIEYTKGSSLKEKVIESDEIERAGEEDRPHDGDLRVLRDMLSVHRWILWSDDEVANSFNYKKKRKDKCNYRCMVSHRYSYSIVCSNVRAHNPWRRRYSPSWRRCSKTHTRTHQLQT